MDGLERDVAGGLFHVVEGPCLSLYMPTHRRPPDNQQNPIRFRNLLRALRESLCARYSGREAAPLLDPLERLADDRDFWNRTLDGLAALASPAGFHVYRLQQTVREMAVVAPSFRTKPLLQVLGATDRYQVLALDSRRLDLLEGGRDALDPVDLAPGVPRCIEEALGQATTEPRLTVASHGGAEEFGAHRVHGGRKEEAEVDTSRFFRAVDQSVLDAHSIPSGLPLLLAALPEHQSVYRRIAQNRLLLADGLETNPFALAPEALRERAWSVVAPRVEARMGALARAYADARARGLGEEDLAEVAAAVAAGRVATLLLEADRDVAGRLDPASGAFWPGELADASGEDALDGLGQLAVRRGAQVVVLPADRMPSATGAAALCRY
ncbi:MAG TPA: hypothetical protein VLH79_08380 [Chthonomonadales bacterium]|nr:hypothetical protein [Chthonomonadales bacterium]